jgi:MarR family transcriptional regulator, organic hydroperoxide resistance regulator
MAVTRTRKKTRKPTSAVARSRSSARQRPSETRAKSGTTRTSGSVTASNAAVGTAADSLYDDFLPYLVARLAHLLNNDLIEKLRTEDINVARWRILAVLAMGDGITISEIIDRAMMQQSALSRVLMTMEEEEYVRRVPRQDDGRYVDVFLTDRGRELFTSLDAVVRRRQNRLLKNFTPQDVDAAFALMRRLIHNLAE